MKILAIDSSSLAASAAIWQGDKLLGEFFINAGLTHSQTLMPMVQQLLHTTQTALEDLDCFAVSVGPGSFTGLRIGISAVKGMAFGLQKPCVAVSTLEGLACNLQGFDGILCPVMDARCQQVYTALFEAGAGGIRRLTDDAALPLEELGILLKKQKKSVILVGDGALMCYNNLDQKEGIAVAPAPLRHQRAASVGAVALQRARQGAVCPADALVPAYLRLPQAQRELLARQQPKG